MLIQGTAGPDNLSGTNKNDTLRAGAGDDIIRGLRGNDVLEGEAGDDSLDGGGGTDTLYGGEGNDTANYGANTASIVVRLINDWEEESFFDRTDEVSFPGTGWAPERLFSIENVTTGSSDDTLMGDEHDNLLIAGAGDDLLDGGLGNDTLDGGDGNDTVAFDRNDYLAGEDGSGYSWFEIDGSEYVSAHLSGENGSLSFGGRSEGPNASRYATKSLIGIEHLSTGFGDDSLSGSDDANILSSGAGNDLLSGDRGADTLLGGDGDDTLAGGGGTDRLDGGAGLDVAEYSDTTVNMRGVSCRMRFRFRVAVGGPSFSPPSKASSLGLAMIP